MTQPTDPNQQDPFQPGYTPPPQVPPPRTIDYQTPQRTSFWGPYNRWWMILLRILGGISLGLVAAFMGAVLASYVNFPFIMFLPGMVMLGILIFISIRFRRFGYVTGFLLAPFIIAAGICILLFILCATWKP